MVPRETKVGPSAGGQQAWPLLRPLAFPAPHLHHDAAYADGRLPLGVAALGGGGAPEELLQENGQAADLRSWLRKRRRRRGEARPQLSRPTEAPPRMTPAEGRAVQQAEAATAPGLRGPILWPVTAPLLREHHLCCLLQVACLGCHTWWLSAPPRTTEGKVVLHRTWFAGTPFLACSASALTHSSLSVTAMPSTAGTTHTGPSWRASSIPRAWRSLRGGGTRGGGHEGGLAHRSVS